MLHSRVMPTLPALRRATHVGLAATLLAVAAAACSRAPATPTPTPLASTADSAAVAGTLTRMFDALRTKDAATLRGILHADARFTLLRPAPDGSVRVNVITGDQFLQSTTGPNARGLDEPIRNIHVTVDGPLATAWAEYQVRVNGAVSHCGYDAFHLVKTAAGWQVLNTADSFRREGCGPLWP
jgi:hypothetical protein